MIKNLIITFLLPFALISNAYADAKMVNTLDDMIANNQLSEAMSKINKTLKSTPEDLDLLARKSRILTLNGNQAKNKDEKVRLYNEAIEVATKAVELHPSEAQGYLRRAIARGKLILYKGIFESRSLVLKLKSDSDKVLELDNTSKYEQALANYLLGKSNLKLAQKSKLVRVPMGLGWASKKNGAEHLKNAYNLWPPSVPFTLDYALYLKKSGDKEQAKKLLLSINELKSTDPGDAEHKETAKKVLAELN